MYIPATDADIPALVALINRAYRGDTGSGWSTEEPISSVRGRQMRGFETISPKSL